MERFKYLLALVVTMSPGMIDLVTGEPKRMCVFTESDRFRLIRDRSAAYAVISAIGSAGGKLLSYFTCNGDLIGYSSNMPCQGVCIDPVAAQKILCFSGNVAAIGGLGLALFIGGAAVFSEYRARRLDQQELEDRV